MNGKPLPIKHGAPLRLRVETQVGFKMAKWINQIEFINDYSRHRLRAQAAGARTTSTTPKMWRSELVRVCDDAERSDGGAPQLTDAVVRPELTSLNRDARQRVLQQVAAKGGHCEGCGATDFDVGHALYLGLPVSRRG